MIKIRLIDLKSSTYHWGATQITVRLSGLAANLRNALQVLKETGFRKASYFKYAPSFEMRFSSSSVTLSAAILFLAFGQNANAISLGNLNVRSNLGEPFRASLPVNLQSGEQLSQSCIRVLPPRNRRDDVPMLHSARVALEERNGAPHIWIVSSQRIDEPAIKLSIQVGCDNPIQREFVVLLDPPTEAVLADRERKSSEPEPKLEFYPRYTREIRAEGPGLKSSRDIKAESDAPTATSEASGNRSLQTNKPSSKGTKHKPIQSASGVAEAVSPLLEPGVLPPSRTLLTPDKSKTAKLKKAEPLPSEDRLRIFSPDADAYIADSTKQTGMKLAPTLKTGEDGLVLQPNLSAEKLEEIRREQRKLMAHLRDEDLLSQTLNNEMALKQEVNALNVELESLRRSAAEVTKPTKSWASYVIGGFVALGAFLLIWLLAKIRSSQKDKAGEPWWDQQVTQAKMDQQQDQNEWNQVEALIQQDSPATDYVNTEFGKKQSDEDLHSKLMPNPSWPASHRGPREHWSPTLELDIPTHGPLPSFGVSVEEFHDSDQTPGNPPDSLPSIITAEDATTATTESTMTPDIAPSSANATDNAPDPWASADPRLSVAQAEQKTETPKVNTIQTGLPNATDSPTNQTPSPYKLALAKTIMSYVEQTPELRMNYEQARQLQEKLGQTAALLDKVDKQLAKEQTENVISLLRHRVHENIALPPVVWLILFDLYKRTNRRSVYESLLVIFQRRFGRAMISWQEYDSQNFQIALDEMPELMDSIWQHWGTPQGMEFLQRLCHNPQAPDEIFFNRGLAQDAINLAKILPLQADS